MQTGQAPTISAPQPSEAVRRFAPLAPLKFRGFRLLTFAMVPHMLAMQMSTVALGYLAFELTGAATALGLIGLGWGIPMLVLSLWGGVVADRFPRRMILLATQGLIGLAALTGAILLLTDTIQVWHILVIALMQGTAFAFNMPARQALIAQLVPAPDLPSAIALNNTIMNVARVAGPPLAGLLIAAPFFGVDALFVLMALMYVVVLALVWRVPVDNVAVRPTTGGWQALVEGLQFIRHSPALLGLLALAFAPMFFGMPFQLLMPVFALGIFQAGPAGLGLLNMAAGLGAVAGSLAVGMVTRPARQRQVQGALGISFGAGLIALALCGSVGIAAVVLAIVGASSAGYLSINNTLVLEEAPHAFHGRVMSVYMMTFALMPLASFPAARLADEIGAARTVAGMGIALLVTVIAVTLWQRRAITTIATASRVAGAD